MKEHIGGTGFQPVLAQAKACGYIFFRRLRPERIKPRPKNLRTTLIYDGSQVENLCH